MTDILLSIQDVSKKFGAYQALSNINLDVNNGEFIAMLGPSGCGKTTLLRSIAGFITPDSGRIVIGGEELTQQPPNRRPLNTVFQNYALFPHMRVVDNVAYGPRRKGVPRAQARELASEALTLVSLAALADRYPQELSGGQQQRVALARALVNRPQLLLLDEPLSALDLKLRKQMQIELKHLQEKLGISFVFVTHDQEEAMTMADRIVVMNGGKIEQVGRGEEIYHRPASRFVADFIGEANFLSGQWLQQAEGSPNTTGDVLRACDQVGAEEVAMLRPEQISVLHEPHPSFTQVSGTVQDLIDVGAHMTLVVAIRDELVRVRMAAGAPKPARGTTVLLGFNPADLWVLKG